MFTKIKLFFHRWLKYRSRKDVHTDLDILLSQKISEKSLRAQLEWLVLLLHWIQYEGTSDGKPQARLRFVLQVLDRNIEWKNQVAKTLKIIASKVSGFELYSETGLSKELGFWGELTDRLISKILPSPPLDEDLGHLFWALFPYKENVDWLGSVDSETFIRLLQLFNFHSTEEEPFYVNVRSDIEAALNYLVIQIQALALTPAMRHRMGHRSFQESMFLKLSQVKQSFTKEEWETLLSRCDEEIEQIYKHFDEYGVSMSLVFQVMRLRGYLNRVRQLLQILFADKLEPKAIQDFLAGLIKDNHELQSVSSLFAQNGSLLASKIVERAAHTGEHYITKTKAEYYQMLQMAAGGGLLTSITVYVKLFILKLGMAGFVEGFFASMNYAISFLAIHFSGFTLGTKQPAMTAPALAEKMRDLNSEQGIAQLVSEIKNLIRSQMASIFGNILLVVPSALAITACYEFYFGTHIMSVEKARYTFQSVDIAGPALIYGCFTGVLLWLSSVASGSADNWFVLRSMKRSLARSPSLRMIFGDIGALRIAIFLRRNFAAMVGNIFLGFLLGMIPEIMKFVGIPLDIRHVTLSSGNMAAAFPVLGIDFVKSWDFWRGVCGVLGIGLVNVSVSFSLALFIAIKARSVNPPQRQALRKALWREFWSRPWGFIIPS